MAKVSAVAKNNRRKEIAIRDQEKRAKLRLIANNADLPFEERLEAQLKLASLPRDGSKVRYRNRCSLTGRPRAYFRKFGLSRIALRDLAAWGQVPGLTKSSW